MQLTCSADTYWNVRIFLNPNTFTSFGTFWTPVSSPDQIWSSDVTSAVFIIFLRSTNQDPITVWFVPMARVVDRLWAFFNVICGVVIGIYRAIFALPTVSYHWNLFHWHVHIGMPAGIHAWLLMGIHWAKIFEQDFAHQLAKWISVTIWGHRY